MDLWLPAAWSTALPEPKRVAEGIAMDLAKIGVQVTLRTGVVATYRADARANRFALWLDEASAELADPDAYLGADTPANPVAAELVRRARAETDPSKRGELYKQVTKLTQQDVSRIPLFSADGHLALTARVRGFAAQPIGPDSLAAVWIGK
jgi:ABC-type transport system substrate-binding protein